MEQSELALGNRVFLVTEVPSCLYGKGFQEALGAAYVLMQNIRNEGRYPDSTDYCHCSCKTGYVGVTAAAAEIIKNENLHPFVLATEIHRVIGAGAHTNNLNDRILVTVQGKKFLFLITDYEADDPEQGWVNVTKDSLSVSSEWMMHRRVIIDLA